MNRTGRFIVTCAVSLTVAVIALVLFFSQSAAQAQRDGADIKVAGRYQVIPRLPHEQEIMILDTTTGAVYKLQSQQFSIRNVWVQMAGPIGQ